MLHLVYISTARQPIDQRLCADILAASRVNNRAAGLTGLLVAGRTRFLQALEGPADAVRATYARIGADPRHYACVILAERTLDQRLFGEWAMGFTAGGEAAVGSDLGAIVAALVAPVDDANLRAHFTGFAEVQSNAA